MRAHELRPDPSAVERQARRREGLARLQARLADARKWKGVIAELAAKTKRTRVRTDTEADVLSGAVFKLHHTIYMIHLIKQALIGL